MKIHEYQARQLLTQAGIPVPSGEVVDQIDSACSVSEQIGFPLVLKAQVLVGGRGKAGGIKIVNNQAELKENFENIKNIKIKGYDVDKILMTPAVEIKKEYYMAVAVDSSKNDIVIIGSDAGGVDIEETAKKTPHKIRKFYLNGSQSIDENRWPEFIESVFSEADGQAKGTDVFKAMLKIFIEKDCSLVEINPYVRDKNNRWMAVDAKINFDDNAVFRHPDVERLRDIKYEDPDEMEAKRNDLSFVKLDGNIGCIVNGAGLAMATMDVIHLAGGSPANFLDVGGSSSPEKVLNALKIILRNKKVKTVLINIFGGITRCDDIANGLVEAKQQLDICVPLVVRLTGTNEELGVAILKEKGIKTFSSMREAVQQVVEIAKK